MSIELSTNTLVSGFRMKTREQIGGGGIYLAYSVRHVAFNIKTPRHDWVAYTVRSKRPAEIQVGREMF